MLFLGASAQNSGRNIKLKSTKSSGESPQVFVDTEQSNYPLGFPGTRTKGGVHGVLYDVSMKLFVALLSPD